MGTPARRSDDAAGRSGTSHGGPRRQPHRALRSYSAGRGGDRPYGDCAFRHPVGHLLRGDGHLRSGRIHGRRGVDEPAGGQPTPSGRIRRRRTRVLLRPSHDGRLDSGADLAALDHPIRVDGATATLDPSSTPGTGADRRSDRCHGCFGHFARRRTRIWVRARSRIAPAERRTRGCSLVMSGSRRASSARPSWDGWAGCVLSHFFSGIPPSRLPSPSKAPPASKPRSVDSMEAGRR